MLRFPHFQMEYSVGEMRGGKRILQSETGEGTSASLPIPHAVSSEKKEQGT